MSVLALGNLNKKHAVVVKALFMTFMLFYLVSHALSGERGLYVLFKEQRHLEQLRAELEQVTNKRKNLEHKQQMLSNSTLDLDLLDEQVRRNLGKAAKDEMIILLNQGK